MPAKITKEVRERIYVLNKEGKNVKEILVIMGVDGIKISDKSIYRILKEKKNNESMASFEESFNESFGDDLNMEEKILPPLVRNTIVIEEEKGDTVVTQGVYKGIISIYRSKISIPS